MIFRGAIIIWIFGKKKTPGVYWAAVVIAFLRMLLWLPEIISAIKSGESWTGDYIKLAVVIIVGLYLVVSLIRKIVISIKRFKDGDIETTVE